MRVSIGAASTLLTGVVLVGWVSASAQEQTAATALEEAPVAEERQTEYLVSVAAGGGAVLASGEQEDCYTLTLENAGHVTWFSDRPEREAHSSHVYELTDAWQEAFADSAPNADLQMFREDGSTVTVVLELGEAPVWNAKEQTLTFANACAIPIDEEGGEAVPMTPDIRDAAFPIATLFIDDVSIQAAAKATINFINCDKENRSFYVFNGGDIFCVVPRHIKNVSANGGTNSAKCNDKKRGCIVALGKDVSLGSCFGSGYAWAKNGNWVATAPYRQTYVTSSRPSC